MYIYHKQCEIIQKFNEKAQTANFSDITRQRQELCAENTKTRDTKMQITQNFDLSLQSQDQDVSLVNADDSSTSSPGVPCASAILSSSPGVVSKAPVLKPSPSAPVILKKPVRMLNGDPVWAKRK